MFSNLYIVSNSSKEAIVSLLSENWPRTAKAIYSSLKSSYGFSLSYQAVHKTLGELVSQGVLSKQGSGYSLNPVWIKRVKNFGERVDRLYSAPDKVREFGSGDIVNLLFEKFADFGRFVIFAWPDQFPNPENKARIYFFDHAWATAGFDEPEVKKLRESYAKTPTYLIIRNNTVLDKYFAESYRKMGKHVFTGVDFPFDGELMVSGDYVCNYFFTSVFKKRFYSFYGKIKSIEKLNSLDIVNLYYEKLPIRAVVTRNPELADSLRKWVLDFERGN